MEDGLVRLSKKPRIEMMILAHEVKDIDDVVMGLCIDHSICDKRIRAGKGFVDAIIDVGILGDRKTLIGGEDAFEEGEKGWHIGEWVD